MIFTRTHDGPRPFGTTSPEFNHPSCHPIGQRRAPRGHGFIISFDCGLCKAWSPFPLFASQPGPAERSSGTSDKPKRTRGRWHRFIEE